MLAGHQSARRRSISAISFALDFRGKLGSARTSALLGYIRAFVRLNLPIEFVDDFVDRGVHVLAALFRVEVLTARRNVHVGDVLRPLDGEGDLSRHRLTKELLKLCDLVMRVLLNGIRTSHVAERDCNVHRGPPSFACASKARRFRARSVPGHILPS